MSKCPACLTVDSAPYGLRLTFTDSHLCMECSIIQRASWEAISVARQVGVPKYGSSSWKEDHEHLLRAYWHVVELVRREMPDYAFVPPDQHRYSYEQNEDHLSHAICRLAMVKALLK